MISKGTLVPVYSQCRTAVPTWVWVLCAGTWLLGRPTDGTDPLLFVDLFSEWLSNIITLQILENLSSTRDNFKISENQTELKQWCLGPGDVSSLLHTHGSTAWALFSGFLCKTCVSAVAEQDRTQFYVFKAVNKDHLSNRNIHGTKPRS